MHRCRIVLIRIVIGYVFKLKVLEDHLLANSRLGRGAALVWTILIRLVAPATLLGLLSLSVYNLIKGGYGGYPRWALGCLGLLWLVAALIAGIVLSRLRWRREPRYSPDEDISTED